MALSLSQLGLGLSRRGVGGGGSPPPAVIGATSASGHKIIVPLPAGFVATNQSIVDPSLISVEVDAPSVNATATPTVTTRPRRCGYRADVVGGNLEIWMAQPIPAVATAVRVNASAGAITNGASSSAPFSGTITNNAEESAAIQAHLLRFVDGAQNYGVAHSVMSAPFWIEGLAFHEAGIACVKFDVVQGGTTRTSYAVVETRSRYRDSEIITLAQWAKNGNAGVGVWSSAQILPADFADGPATVTMTAYARIGGVSVSRAISWPVVMNHGGTYQQRIRFVDNVAGNDTWDGTAQTFQGGSVGPKLTLQAAVLAAGSVNGGATTTSIPIVRCVGSGNPASPRTYEMYTGTGSGNAIASATDTWLTIEPAAGHSSEDTQVANYTSIGGVTPRIRRLRIHNMKWEISETSGGTSCSALINAQLSVYPPESNPESVWFDRVDSYHALGRLGQTSEGASGSLIGSNFRKNHLCFFTNFVARDMARRGIQCSGLYVVWNHRFDRVFKDIVKQPDCVAMGVWRDNATPKTVLPLSNITGTPTAGDTISGVYSTGTVTVASYSAPNVTLNAGQDWIVLKFDDAKQCRRITLTGIVGTFTAGQTITVGAASHVIGRVEGSDLYLRTVDAVSNGATVTGPSGSGTVSSNALSECLLFTPSGARARALPPHSDGLQVQDALDQRIYFTSPVGTFQVGETVTAPGSLPPCTITAVGPNFIDITGNSLKFFAPSVPVADGATITGATSLATATYNRRLSRFINNDRNIIVYNILGDNVDGQPLFSENGSRGLAIVNISMSATIGPTTFQSQFASTPDTLVLHVSHPNKRIANRSVPGMSPNGWVRSAYRWCVAEQFVSDDFPQGATNAVDAWQAASEIRGCHAINPTPAFSEFDIGMTRGSAQWVNGVGYEEDYDPARVEYAPAVGSPLRNKVPAGEREVRYDLFGNERPNDGTASAGAAQEWVATSFVAIDNQGTAYSRTPSITNETGLRKLVVAFRMRPDAVTTNANLIADSAASFFRIWFPATTAYRAQFLASNRSQLRPVLTPGNLMKTHMITLDFTNTTANQGCLWATAEDGVLLNNTPGTGGVFDTRSVPGTGTDYGAHSFNLTGAVSLFGSTPQLGIFGESDGGGVLFDGAFEFLWIDWGGSGYTIPDITDVNVRNKFRAGDIGSNGNGPTGAQPKLFWTAADLAEANSGGGMPNRGSLAGITMTKQAGTYV